MLTRGWRRAATAAGLAVLALSALAVPARADSYTSYLIAQLRADPVYISSYSEMATPSDAPAIKRLISRIPLQTYVVADVGAGPDGQIDDGALAAVLHDQLGGGLFILARRSDDMASATGFGTSLPVSDAMTAANEELLQGGPGSLVQLVQRFVTILLSGRTEQRLAAADRAVQRLNTPAPGPSPGALAAAMGSGTAVGCAATGYLLIILRRRRRRRTRLSPAGGSSGALK